MQIRLEVFVVMAIPTVIVVNVIVLLRIETRHPLVRHDVPHNGEYDKGIIEGKGEPLNVWLKRARTTIVSDEKPN